MCNDLIINILIIVWAAFITLIALNDIIIIFVLLNLHHKNNTYG